jgi:hypothetical protein
MITDVSIDPAGNVRAANNWNSVIYGGAAPVKAPRMGQVRAN